MSNKTVVNSPADGIVQLAILCIYMRRIINYDWATVNISVLIKQRNISVSEWYFPKNHEIVSLVVRKVKNLRESRQYRELTWTSEKRFKKFINFCLKVGHSANLKHIKFHMKTTYRPVKGTNHNVRSSGHNARSALLDRGTGTIDLRQLLFWHRKFSCDPTNYDRCLHLSDTLTYRSVHNNSFLTLRVRHELKRGSGFFKVFIQGIIK